MCAVTNILLSSRKYDHVTVLCTVTMGVICNYIGTIVYQVLFIIQHASKLWYEYQILLTDIFFFLVHSFDENLDQVCVCVCVNEVGKKV